jgi:hypothetical protein
MSGMAASSTPSWGIGKGTHSWVFVSMAVSVTGFRSSGMVDAFLRCHRARPSCIMRNLLIPCLEELETGDGTAGVACPAPQATAPVRRQGR